MWRGKRPLDATYYVSSYFWDRALDTGIIKDEKALVWTTAPSVSTLRSVEARVGAGRARGGAALRPAEGRVDGALVAARGPCQANR